MVALWSGADIDDKDVGVIQYVRVIESRGHGFRQGLHFGEAVRPDLADMQLVDERRARQRLRADTAAPARPDHRGFDLFHFNLPSCRAATEPRSLVRCKGVSASTK